MRCIIYWYNNFPYQRQAEFFALTIRSISSEYLIIRLYLKLFVLIHLLQFFRMIQKIIHILVHVFYTNIMHKVPKIFWLLRVTLKIANKQIFWRVLVNQKFWYSVSILVYIKTRRCISISKNIIRVLFTPGIQLGYWDV